MDKQLFQIPAIIETIRTLSDKTLKLTVSTARELDPEEELKILRLKQLIGWMVFSEAEIKEEDIPDEPAPEFKSDKTPSQKLRALIFKDWEQNTNKKIPFNNYYIQEMDKYIKHRSDRLEP